MARPNGLAKTGGRKKGTPNKKTTVLIEDLESNGLDLVEQLAEVLPQLDPGKRADILMDLMGYVYPKRKAVEISNQDLSAQSHIFVTIPSNGREDPRFTKLTPESEVEKIKRSF